MYDDSVPILMAHYSFDFTSLRIIDDLIIPSDFAVRIEMVPNSESTPEEIETAMKKIEFWIDIVSKSVMCCVDNPAGVDILIDGTTHTPRVGNSIMLMPNDPDEETIAKVIQAKFNALANGSIIFTMIEINSTSGYGVGYTYLGDAREDLPDMEDWVGKKPNWFKTPWWNRDDASTVDSVPSDDDSLKERPKWAFTLDFVNEKTSGKGDVVIATHKFKPQVIDGKPTDGDKD